MHDVCLPDFAMVSTVCCNAYAGAMVPKARYVHCRIMGSKEAVCGVTQHDSSTKP